MGINLDDLTLGQIKEIKALLGVSDPCVPQASSRAPHPMLGRRCIVRTYSAGVHIGLVQFVDGMECLLRDALRLWKWEGGGLSLSAIANKGIVKGRLDRTGEIYLTEAIEFIPLQPGVEATFDPWIEG